MNNIVFRTRCNARRHRTFSQHTSQSVWNISVCSHNIMRNITIRGRVINLRLFRTLTI